MPLMLPLRVAAAIRHGYAAAADAAILLMPLRACHFDV